MANTNAPRGLVPVCYKSGKPYTGPGTKYYKGTTANMVIATGDTVLRIASTDANGYPELTRATAGAAITGVVIGIDVQPDNLTKQGALSATDTGYVMVCDDPDVLFMVQEGGSSTALAAAQIGKHIDHITALDGNTLTGQSKLQLDNGAVAADNQFRLERLADMPGNAMGQYAKWIVAVNLSTEVNKGASNLSETA